MPTRRLLRPACANWKVPRGELNLHDWQRNRCGFCGVKGQRLVLDHCHWTGLVRGYLCYACNNHEWGARSPEWASWRDGVNPAGILGLEEIYISSVTGRPVLYERFTPPTKAEWDEIARKGREKNPALWAIFDTF